MRQLVRRFQTWRQRRNPKFRVAYDDYSTHMPILIGLACLRSIRRVMEFGSGRYSSRLFLDRLAFPDLVRLVSYENDRQWFESMRGELEVDQRADFLFRDAPMAEVAREVSGEEFDLIFFDDSQTVADRAATVQAVISKIGPQTICVVHDGESPELQEAMNLLPQRLLFTAWRPCTLIAWHEESLEWSKLKRLDQLLRHGARLTRPTDLAAWNSVFATL